MEKDRKRGREWLIVIFVIDKLYYDSRVFKCYFGNLKEGIFCFINLEIVFFVLSVSSKTMNASINFSFREFLR